MEVSVVFVCVCVCACVGVWFGSVAGLYPKSRCNGL